MNAEGSWQGDGRATNALRIERFQLNPVLVAARCDEMGLRASPSSHRLTQTLVRHPA